jgi:undecaprenyl-diphosphatase
LTVTEAVLLGAVQGLTEFLPVSSSAHLIFVQHYLRGFDPSKAPLFDVTLHVGTLLSLLVYYRREIFDMAASMFAPGRRAQTAPDAPDRRYVFMIVLATIATALIAFPLRDFAESEFKDPKMIRIVGLELVVTGLLLVTAERLARRHAGRSRVGPADAAIVGLAQGLGAAFGGISRSGATIAAALYRGLDPRAAVRFSFLLSIPAILGAVVLEGRSHLGGLAQADAIPFVVGTLTAFLVGMAAIKMVVEFVQRGRLVWFAVYCWAVGIAVVLFA